MIRFFLIKEGKEFISKKDLDEFMGFIDEDKWIEILEEFGQNKNGKVINITRINIYF